MQNGFVQFTDASGKVITTNGALSFVKDGDRNLAFYGSKGRSNLTDTEFATIHADIGLPVPKASVFVTADDDDDFTLPS